MVNPIDPTSAAFLYAESRTQPMHVGGLQLFEKPEGAGRDYARQMYTQMSAPEEIAPLFLKRPHRSLGTAGQLVWVPDEHFDIEHHVRHSALPRPGRVRELLDLCSRLHSQRLAWERPLWEAHVVEGLRDGRVAMYTKTHHALVDGVSAMRLLASVLTTDPDKRDMPAPWAARPASATAQRTREAAESSLADVPMSRAAYGVRAHRRGRRAALGAGQDAHPRPAQRDLGRLALRAADDVQPVDHRVPPLRRPGLADRADAGHRRRRPGRTINDVVLAMCSGALRAYLHRPRRPARHRPGGDGAGRPQRQAVAGRLRRRRQRGRLGDGPAGHRPRPTRPPAWSRSTARCATASRRCRR